MDIYQSDDYKETLRGTLKALKKERPATTFKSVAKQVPMQYTYLSRIMNDSGAHFTEDQLFRICSILMMRPEQTDFILVLRSYATANSPDRKKFLFQKIERLKKERTLSAEVQSHASSKIAEEMAYLFDPLTVLIHMALHIDAIKKNPLILVEKLGIRQTQLKECLRKLEAQGWIVTEERPLLIKKISNKSLHFGRDHPLMRVHQQLLKTMLNSQLMRTAEKDKHSFLATFTADASSFEKIKDAFQEFLSKVEHIAKKARDEKLYQVNFDVFQWL